jgi:hypothetical protein
VPRHVRPFSLCRQAGGLGYEQARQ